MLYLLHLSAAMILEMFVPPVQCAGSLVASGGAHY